jgi:hypothetical protein
MAFSYILESLDGVVFPTLFCVLVDR